MTAHRELGAFGRDWAGRHGAVRSRAGRTRTERRLVGALVGLAAFAAGWLSSGPLLDAAAARAADALAFRRVQVSGCERLDPAEVVASAGLAAPLPWTDLDRSALTAKLEAHPWVVSTRLAPLPPDTLLVRVRERRPLAIVGPADAPRLVDERGEAFAPAGPEDVAALPRLLGDGAPAARRLGAEIARAVTDASLPAAREIDLGAPNDAERPTLRLAGLDAPVVLGPGPLAEKLGRLARLLAADVEELARAERIDLRFAERAILRVSPPRTGAEQRREGADATSRPNRDPSSSGGPASGG